MCGGPFGDRIVGGDVLDGFLRTDIYEQRIDLDELTGNLGFPAFWQAPGVALLCVVTEALACGFAAQERNGFDRAAGDEPGKNAPDRRDGEGNALAPEQHGDLAFAPHGITAARLFDALSLEACVVRLARPVAFGIGLLLPANGMDGSPSRPAD